MELEGQVMRDMLQTSGIVTASGYSGYYQEAMLSAYDIGALQPWGLLPVAPEHFIAAFTDLAPFRVTREESLGEFSIRLRRSPPEGP